MADAMTQAMDQQVEGRLSRMTASLELTPEQVQAAREILKRQAVLMRFTPIRVNLIPSNSSDRK